MMDLSAESRLEAKLDPIRRVLTEAGGRLAYFFGSAARRAERADSDLDIAVVLAPTVPRERYGDIHLGVTTDLVGITHTNDVDLIILNAAPPLLSFQVISTGRLFLGDRREQVRFEVSVLQGRLRDRL